MTMSVSELFAWEDAALVDLSRLLSRREGGISDLQAQLDAVRDFGDWTGDSADDARLSGVNISWTLQQRAAAVAALALLAEELAALIAGLKEDLRELVDDAESDFYLVSENGNVADIKPDVDDDDTAAREHKRSTLETAIKAVLVSADDAEDDTARILDTVVNGEIPGTMTQWPDIDPRIASSQWADQQFAPPPPPEDVAAQQRYWDTLPEATRDFILEHDPDLIVNAYGLDPALRHQAALNYIPILRTSLQQQFEAAQQPGTPFSDSSPSTRSSTLRDKIADLDAIDSQLSNDTSGELVILGMRENSQGVGVIFAHGDITSARNIAVHTPGMGTTTRYTLEDQTTLAKRLRDEMDHVSRFYDETSPSTAVVSYMNMDFPADLSHAGHGNAANQAAPDLAGLINGTDTVAGSDTHITAVGHSYGSLTTSEALQEGTKADAAVFYGSPGIETGDDAYDFDATQLHVPSESVYAMQTHNDPIRFVPIFGPSPTTIDGITHLELDPEYLQDRTLFNDRYRAEGHSGYHRYEDGTGHIPASLTNIAAVSTDHTAELKPFDAQGRQDKIIEELRSNPDRFLIGGP